MIIARATGIELTGEVTDLTIEQALYKRMNVLVTTVEPFAAFQRLGNAVEALDQVGLLVVVNDPGIRERPHPRFCDTDVVRPQPMIDAEARVERVQRLAARL